MEKSEIGMVGFGQLGSVAAAALKRDGYQVMSFDPSPAARRTWPNWALRRRPV